MLVLTEQLDACPAGMPGMWPAVLFDNTWPLCFWLSICSLWESSLVNQPVVQECVSCPVRGLLPSGIHENSFPNWKRAERAPLAGSDKNCLGFAARMGTMGWNDKWLCKGEGIHPRLPTFFFMLWPSNVHNVQTLIMFTTAVHALQQKKVIKSGFLGSCMSQPQTVTNIRTLASSFLQLPCPAEFVRFALCVSYTHTLPRCLWATLAHFLSVVVPCCLQAVCHLKQHTVC